ncbi:flagellar biosynthetic protein FliR [Cellulomonas fengjieae]|uniref:Flagellar biosynthetic protein FliR n=1 Tax=Cellulomonas fengjieae TaxID=2819978 RepID=A0ABS3SIZ6_9CELL|nr:flagellar biosynthetic protein FliR [Cellulomonas fengjieae]MBO3084920.1 flagellar biosynthetic protein FliR [Cellulomonas fengjieae]QVI66477.1 flagellar biosynthetic protein FliR [Cellulomonas fengjieae]
MTVALPLAAVQTTMLAGVRIAAFLVIAPPFSHRVVPSMVKIMLALGLALAVAPGLEPVDADGTGAFVGAVVLEAVVGAAFGFLVMLLFSAVQSAGTLIDLFGGFQMAAAFDPMSMTSGAQFQRLYQMTAVVLLFVSDGYQVVLAGLVRTFDALPLGAVMDLSTLAESVTTGLSQMFVGALQIAGPLLVVLFLADVGLGLLTRVAPALNAFALGFPLKILLTLTFGAYAFLALPAVVEGLTGRSVEAMLGVAQ